MLLYVFLVTCLSELTVAVSQPGYKGPVIGILTQTTHGKMEKYGRSYLTASYVKYIESAGAQVVPILDSWDSEKLESVVKSINGVLFPGGAQYFPNSSYYKASRQIYQLAEESNKAGKYYPLWGTCLGFEALLDIAANVTDDLRFRCTAHCPNNVTLFDGAQQSRMLKDMDNHMFQAIHSELIVYNAHSFCSSPDLMTQPEQPLADKFNLLATSWDQNGVEYIALTEHKTMPFYASQFHPEKSGFEWTMYSDIPHSRNAVYFMQYLANFFVTEATKNENKFAEPNEFYALNIANDAPIYALEKFNSSMQQIYFFKGRRSELEVEREREVKIIDF